MKGTFVTGVRRARRHELNDAEWQRYGAIVSVHPENIGHVLLDSLTPFFAYLLEAKNVSAVFATHWRSSLLAQSNVQWFDMRSWQVQMLDAIIHSASCLPEGRSARRFGPLTTTAFCAKKMDIFRDGCDSSSSTGSKRYHSKVYFPLMRARLLSYLTYIGHDLAEMWKAKGSIVIFARTLASRRRISNFQEIVNSLRKATYNETKISVENFLPNMTLAEQANLVASANVVVSTLGAHEANFIFMRPGALYIQVVRSCGIDMTPSVVLVNEQYLEVPGEMQLLWERHANYRDIVNAAGADHYLICTCTYKRKHAGWTRAKQQNFKQLPSSVKSLGVSLREGERDAPDDITIPTSQVHMIERIISAHVLQESSFRARPTM